MRAHTSRCRAYGQPEVALEWSGNDSLDPWGRNLLQWIETEVAQGRKFLPDQTVQYGWSIMKVRQDSDEMISLSEPDFTSMPIVFVNSVSNTLLHTMLQKFVAESVNAEDAMNFPSLRQSCIVCSKFGDQQGLVAERQQPSNERDSGWFFGCQQPDHSHNTPNELQLKSLYECAACVDSRVIPFLALPVGFRVDLRGERITVSRSGDVVPIKSGSYLHNKYGSAG